MATQTFAEPLNRKILQKLLSLDMAYREELFEYYRERIGLFQKHPMCPILFPVQNFYFYSILYLDFQSKLRQLNEMPNYNLSITNSFPIIFLPSPLIRCRKFSLPWLVIFKNLSHIVRIKMICKISPYHTHFPLIH